MGPGVSWLEVGWGGVPGWSQGLLSGLQLKGAHRGGRQSLQGWGDGVGDLKRPCHHLDRVQACGCWLRAEKPGTPLESTQPPSAAFHSACGPRCAPHLVLSQAPWGPSRVGLIRLQTSVGSWVYLEPPCKDPAGNRSRQTSPACSQRASEENEQRFAAHWLVLRRKHTWGAGEGRVATVERVTSRADLQAKEELSHMERQERGFQVFCPNRHKAATVCRLLQMWGLSSEHRSNLPIAGHPAHCAYGVALPRIGSAQ